MVRRMLLGEFKETKYSRIHTYIIYTFVRTFKLLYREHDYNENPLSTKKKRANCWSNINSWKQIVMR